tara:strand:- start:936 stop:1865 length:930 start_codon:yes stop_codon:yes gene_type:complete
MNNEIKKFQFFQKRFTIFFNLIKYVIFSLITSKSNKLFNKGSDKLSIISQTEGVYEPVLNEYLKYCVNQKRMSDFLIDIGANIGLISCQSGKLFKQVICFEPNPLCLNILKVNTTLTLDTSKLEIYPYGLGENDEVLDLWIPKKNWGGAFVKSKHNLYDEKTLANKDEFFKLEKNNYIIKKVKICSSESKLKEIFDSLLTKNLTRGIIKIDVEGMEMTILKGLSKILPKNMQIEIIFENWNEKLNFLLIEEFFLNRKITLNKFNNKIRYKHNSSRLIKGLKMLLSSNFTTLKELKKDEDLRGDLVISIL